MRHPAEDALRRLLDEPAGVAEADRQHVAGCSQCLGGLSGMRSDAALVGAALAPDAAAGVDVAAAWQRLGTAAPAPRRGRTAAPPRAGRLRGVLRRPAVALLAVAVVLGGAGTAVANDSLQIFRTERVVPISLSTGDLITLPDLSAYGELAVTGTRTSTRSPLAATGRAERAGEWFTVALPALDDATAVPDLVADLAALGVRVHAVEPGRITLEARLLGIVRDGAEARAGGEG